MGKSIMTDKPSVTNQQLNSIIPNDKVVPDFLYYSLSLRREEFLSLGAGTGVRTPILNKTAFSELSIELPPLETQRKIASILSVYDDLIENNTRRIKILEEMARMIYREWFVNFNFPGHEKVRMVDSPIGKIPEGWEVRDLLDLSVVTYGVCRTYSMAFNQKIVRQTRITC
jgi:type I restriction enzyme S subunit